jgi:hypothetical protein
MDNDGVSLDKAAPNGSGAGEDGAGAGRAHGRPRAESIATRLYSSLTRDSAQGTAGSAEVGWDELRRELDRSRRYGRTFVLVAITQPPLGAKKRRRSSRERFARLGSFLRSVDRAWIVGSVTYVLLPECTRMQGEAFLARVQREASELIPTDGVRMACFPSDGLTSGALLAALDGRPVNLEGKPREAGEFVGGNVDLAGLHAE